jgi:hypothetical protein
LTAGAEAVAAARALGTDDAATARLFIRVEACVAAARAREAARRVLVRGADVEARRVHAGGAVWCRCHADFGGVVDADAEELARPGLPWRRRVAAVRTTSVSGTALGLRWPRAGTEASDRHTARLALAGWERRWRRRQRERRQGRGRQGRRWRRRRQRRWERLRGTSAALLRELGLCDLGAALALSEPLGGAQPCHARAAADAVGERVQHCCGARKDTARRRCGVAVQEGGSRYMLAGREVVDGRDPRADAGGGHLGLVQDGLVDQVAIAAVVRVRHAPVVCGACRAAAVRAAHSCEECMDARSRLGGADTCRVWVVQATVAT